MRFVLWLSMLILVATLNLLTFFLYFNKSANLKDSTIVSVVRSKTKQYLAQTFGSEKCPRNKTLRVTQVTPSINASCSKLFTGDAAEVRRVRLLQEEWTNSISDVEFLEKMSICRDIVPSFSNNFYNSEKEKRFPLGFSLVVSYRENSVQQYVRLLRFIYRPQNVYCLHVDKKSPKIWIKYITAFASCFPNIVLARDSVEVIYASGSILTAHLNCLKELILSHRPWKYAIDLHGTELPLTTNREMVEMLQPLNGVNAIVQGMSIDQVLKEDPESMNALKMTYKAVFVEGKGMRLTTQALKRAPYNMTLYKSADSPNSAFSRDFVQFILIDKRAIALAKYLQDVLSAVEFYFNTLNNLEDAPGGRKDYDKIHNKQQLVKVPVITKRNWKSNSFCHQQFFVHNICIVSVGDLHWLQQLLKNSNRPFFVNKYLATYDHVIMDCMEEHLLKKNSNEYIRDCEKKQG